MSHRGVGAGAVCAGVDVRVIAEQLLKLDPLGDLVVIHGVFAMKCISRATSKASSLSMGLLGSSIRARFAPASRKRRTSRRAAPDGEMKRR